MKYLLDVLATRMRDKLTKELNGQRASISEGEFERILEYKCDVFANKLFDLVENKELTK